MIIPSLSEATLPLWLSAGSLLVSLVCLLCWLFFAVGFFQNPLTKAARRFLLIEEAVVRSVMEEEGTAYVEAILATHERLVRTGMNSMTAMEQARLLHRKRSSDDSGV